MEPMTTHELSPRAIRAIKDLRTVDVLAPSALMCLTARGLIRKLEKGEDVLTMADNLIREFREQRS